MTEVVFPQSIGGNGQRFHDGIGTGGMAEGGHDPNFLLCLQQLIAVCAFIVEQAGLALDAANTAINSPATQATTTTPVAVGTGSKSVTLQQTGKAFIKTQQARIASDADPTKFVEGPITAFAGTALTINAVNFGGSGSFSDGVVTPAPGGGVPSSRKFDTAGVAKGGGDFSANRTITVEAADFTAIRKWARKDAVITPGDMFDAQQEAILQYGQNITTQGDAVLDGERFICGRVLLTGNTFFPNLTRPIVGQTYRIRWFQDGSGNRKVTGWGNGYLIDGGFEGIDWSTAPGAVDVMWIDVASTFEFYVSFAKAPRN